MDDLMERNFGTVDGYAPRTNTLKEIAQTIGSGVTAADVVVFTGLDYDPTGQEPTLADHASKVHAETDGAIPSEEVMRGERPFPPYTPEPTPKDGKNN
jgi:hypothetical protein